MLKLLDLFSGIGGFSHAAHMTQEIETVAFCEIEPYAQKVLAKNYPLVDNYTNVTTLCLEEKDTNEFISKHGRPDIICGGFPCQPFSVARAVDDRAKGFDDARDLWPHMCRVVRNLRPKYILGENVGNFANLALDRTIKDLAREGYTSRAFVLPAVGFNAPHKRERCWILSYAECEGLEGLIRSNYGTERWEESVRSAAESVISSGKACGKNQWGSEPTVCRVVDGVSSRVDRLRCLGNAIVPQVAYVLFQLILCSERIKHELE